MRWALWFGSLLLLCGWNFSMLQDVWKSTLASAPWDYETESHNQRLPGLMVGDVLLCRLNFWRLIYEMLVQGPRILLVHPGYRIVFVDTLPWAGSLRGTRESDLRVRDTWYAPEAGKHEVLQRPWLPSLTVKTLTLKDLIHSADSSFDMSVIQRLRSLFKSAASMKFEALKSKLFAILLDVLESRVPDAHDLSGSYGRGLRSVVEGLGDPGIMGILVRRFFELDHVGHDEVTLAVNGHFPNSATKFRLLLHVWAPFNSTMKACPHTHHAAWFSSKILRGSIRQLIWATAKSAKKASASSYGKDLWGNITGRHKDYVLYDDGKQFSYQRGTVEPIASADFHMNDTYVFPNRWAHSVHPLGGSREDLLRAPPVTLEFRVKGAGREPLYLNLMDQIGGSSFRQDRLVKRVKKYLEAYLRGATEPFFSSAEDVGTAATNT